MSNEEKQPEEEKKTKERKKRKGGRRAYGKGSIFRRPERKGKQWIAQIPLENGKTRQRYFYTQEEAADALNDMLYDQKRGTLITEKDQTVKRQVEHWLENVHKHTVREGTYVEYRRILDKHILPALGHLKLQQLTIQRVEAFYAQKIKNGLKASSVLVIHAVLRQALAHAVRNNLIMRNVCDAVKRPRLNRHEIQPLTKEQAQKFLATAKGHRLEALFIVAMLTGMREGELLALRWSDIDFDNGNIQIRHAVRRIHRRGLVENEPKTASGRRKIVLSPFLLEALRLHRIRQAERRLQVGAAWKENGLVFPNRFGNFAEPTGVIKVFKQLLREANLPSMRFHDLRHSAATFLLAMGVHAKVVQELLGHSSITMTLNIYSHVLPSLQKDAMDKLSDLFDQQDGKSK